MTSRFHLADVLFVAGLLFLAVLGVFRATYPYMPGDGPDERLHVGQHFDLKNYVKSVDPHERLPAMGLRKPLLPYVVSVLASFAYPHGHRTLLLVNLVWCLLWLSVLYRAGRELFGPPAALAAVGVLTAADPFWLIAAHFNNDVVVCFWTAALLAVLQDEARYRRFWPWLLAGVLLGLGLQSKPTALLFGAPALAWVFAVQVYRAWTDHRPAALLEPLVGALAAAGLALSIWSLGKPHFFFELRQLASMVSQEASRQALPFRTLGGRTFLGETWRVFRLPYWLLAAAGTAAAPFVLRRAQRRPWLVAYLAALLAFIRAPQSSTQYIYPVMIAPLWAAIGGLAGRIRRPALAFALLAVGVAGFATKPVWFRVMPPVPTDDNRRYFPNIALGRLLAAQLADSPSSVAPDMFLLHREPRVPQDWPLFVALELIDSPQVGYIYRRAPGLLPTEEYFDRRIEVRRNYIGRLLACGGPFTLEDFTLSVREARQWGRWHPDEPLFADGWPRFAGVIPRILPASVEEGRPECRLWEAPLSPP